MQKRISKHVKRNPATKTFQAIRIFINNELDAIKEALRAGLRVSTSNIKISIQLATSPYYNIFTVTNIFIRQNSPSKNASPFSTPIPTLLGLRIFLNPQS